MKLMDLLPKGEENAISMHELGSLIGMENREVRKMIFNARCAGKIICSSEKGYFLPVTDMELLKWYRIAKARGVATMTTLKKARQILKEAGIDPDGKVVKK